MLRQIGHDVPIVPADPPMRMMRPDLLGDDDYAAALAGHGANWFLVPGASYADFVATRLAPFSSLSRYVLFTLYLLKIVIIYTIC